MCDLHNKNGLAPSILCVLFGIITGASAFDHDFGKGQKMEGMEGPFELSFVWKNNLL